MLAMKYAGKLGPKKQDQARDITPGQDGHYRADRSINLIVMKIIQTPGKDVLCCFPQKAANQRSRKSVAQRYVSVGHKAVNDYKKGEGHQ